MVPDSPCKSHNVNANAAPDSDSLRLSPSIAKFFFDELKGHISNGKLIPKGQWKSRFTGRVYGYGRVFQIRAGKSKSALFHKEKAYWIVQAQSAPFSSATALSCLAVHKYGLLLCCQVADPHLQGILLFSSMLPCLTILGRRFHLTIENEGDFSLRTRVN